MARLTFQTTSEVTAIYDGKFSGIAANTPITTRTTNRAITLTYRQKNNNSQVFKRNSDSLKNLSFTSL